MNSLDPNKESYSASVHKLGSAGAYSGLGPREAYRAQATYFRFVRPDTGWTNTELLQTSCLRRNAITNNRRTL